MLKREYRLVNALLGLVLEERQLHNHSPPEQGTGVSISVDGFLQGLGVLGVLANDCPVILERESGHGAIVPRHYGASSLAEVPHRYLAELVAFHQKFHGHMQLVLVVQVVDHAVSIDDEVHRPAEQPLLDDLFLWRDEAGLQLGNEE